MFGAAVVARVKETAPAAAEVPTIATMVPRAAFTQVTGCGHGREPFVDQDHRHVDDMQRADSDLAVIAELLEPFLRQLDGDVEIAYFHRRLIDQPIRATCRRAESRCVATRTRRARSG